MTHEGHISSSNEKEKGENLSSGASLTPEELTKCEQHIPQTAGHKIHNELTYRAVDWLLNSTIGVAFAYWAARTHSGNKYFGQPVGNFFKKALSPVFKSEAARNEGAKWGTMFAGIMAGGTAIIPPMMVMENKKVKKGMIRWMDEKIYGEKVVAEDPKFEECYQNIDSEPPKSFKAGMIARLIAITPLIVASSTPAINKPLIKAIYDPIGKLSKWGAGKLGIKPSPAMLEKGAMELLDGDPKSIPQFQNNWDFLHRTIGFDFGLTIFYSIMHEAAYKALANIGVGVKKDGVEAEAPASDMLRHGDNINDFSNEFKALEEELKPASHMQRLKKAEQPSPKLQKQSHVQRSMSKMSSELQPQL